MNIAKDWGADKNQWLVELSYGTAIASAIGMALIALFIFRVPVLRLIAPLLRPFGFLFAWTKLLILATPLRNPMRRYVYAPRHLSSQES